MMQLLRTEDWVVRGGQEGIGACRGAKEHS